MNRPFRITRRFQRSESVKTVSATYGGQRRIPFLKFTVGILKRNDGIVTPIDGSHKTPCRTEVNSKTHVRIIARQRTNSVRNRGC